MIREPEHLPDNLPEIIRDSPSYFRGAPVQLMAEIGILDMDMDIPKGPGWPPDGLSNKRAGDILRLFKSPSDDDPEISVLDVNPTGRELRLIQNYMDKGHKIYSARSRKKGKLPAFKFRSNDRWHVIPEECLTIAHKLYELLKRVEEAEEWKGWKKWGEWEKAKKHKEWGVWADWEGVEAFAAFNELAAKYDGYEVC